MESISAFPATLGTGSGSLKLCYMGGFPTKSISYSSNNSDSLVVPKWIFGVVIAYTKFGAWFGGGYSSQDQPYQFGSIIQPGFSASICKSSNMSKWNFSANETRLSAYCPSSGDQAKASEISLILFGAEST